MSPANPVGESVMTTLADGPGLAVVLSGPSGAGKSTVCRLLAERYGYELSVSATTRPPRAGEQHGRQYAFVTGEAFQDMVRRGDFLEWSEHFGNQYGTPLAAVQNALEEGRVILLEIDVMGAVQVRKRLPGAVSIFLTAPGNDEGERRLRVRATDGAEAIRSRLERAGMETAAQNRYDHRVVNDDLERTVEQIHRLIERKASTRNER